MPKHSKPRRGSLQFWPRTRAKKIIPSVNWLNLENKTDKNIILGFLAYKVGMKSAIVRDNTEHSLTKGRKIAIPITVVEVPPMKILSVRFYKKNKIISEVIVGNDKELKKKLKIPKEKINKEKALDEKISKIKDFDDARILIYSLVSRTGIKKIPDISEVALGGNKEQKLEFIKNFLNKEIHLSDFIGDFENNLVDVRGVTKGYGTQGPVKRFGIKLRFHKSEKGRRKVGSIGPWHPSRVTFRVPMAGQTGFFTRLSYNKKFIDFGSISEKNINPKEGWKKYGKIKTDFLILKGSIQGPSKRQLLLTFPSRETKRQSKLNYEFLETK